MENKDTKFQESQDELEKAFGSTVDDDDNDSLEDLNRNGINQIRKSAGAQRLDDVQKGDDDDDDREDDEDEDEDEDDMDKSFSSEYLDGDEVFSSLIKSADGEIVQLIEGNEILGSLIKSFSDQIGNTNYEVAANTTLLKAITRNQELQNRAIIQLGNQQAELKEILGGMPVKKSMRGTLETGSKGVGSSRAEAVDKAISETEDFEDHGDRWGGKNADSVFMLVKKSYDDPETRSKYNLKDTHLSVRRRGIGILPAEFRRDFFGGTDEEG